MKNHPHNAKGLACSCHPEKAPQVYSIRIDDAKKVASKAIRQRMDSADKDEFELAISEPNVQEYVDMVVAEFIPMLSRKKPHLSLRPPPKYGNYCKCNW